MDVPSLPFLGFTLASALIINISRRPLWRRTVLAIANLAFIATFVRDPRQLIPFAALLVAGYVTLELMERYKGRAVFIVLLILLIAAYCWLKRYSFFPPSLLLHNPYLIVGISYVFFRMLHLIIDAYQGSLRNRVGALSYISYTLNFTALISGPIQLYQDYVQTEVENPMRLDLRDVGQSAQRLILGFFKVTIVSPLLYAAFEQCVLLLPSNGGATGIFYATALIAIFPVYIYVNFSGYMDVVIAVATWLRLKLPENFDHPFFSAGFLEFWTRWHITLANWMKTYVYSPLLLALMYRFPSPRAAASLGLVAYFVTFFLVGVWHGRSSMFIFLGVLLGLGVSVNKLYQLLMVKRIGWPRYRALCASPLYAALSRGLTFSWFAFSSLWFWATWRQLQHLAALLGALGIAATLLLLLAGASIVLWALFEILRTLRTAVAGEPAATPYLQTAWYTALAVTTVTVAVVLNAPAPHIVYRAF